MISLESKRDISWCLDPRIARIQPGEFNVFIISHCFVCVTLDYSHYRNTLNRRKQQWTLHAWDTGKPTYWKETKMSYALKRNQIFLFKKIVTWIECAEITMRLIKRRRGHRREGQETIKDCRSRSSNFWTHLGAGVRKALPLRTFSIWVTVFIQLTTWNAINWRQQNEVYIIVFFQRSSKIRIFLIHLFCVPLSIYTRNSGYLKWSLNWLRKRQVPSYLTFPRKLRIVNN